MARPKQPIGLRMVDDGPAPPPVVVRLDTDAPPVRLIPENPNTPQGPAPRLVVPTVETVDQRRSHEPGLEVLMDSQDVTLEDAEEAWDHAATRRHPVPWGWFALIGLLLTGAVAWSISQIQQTGIMLQESAQQVTAMNNETLMADMEIVQMLARMEHTVKVFCEATSFQAMLPMVRHPARVMPLMEDFYKRHPLQPLGFKLVKKFQGAGLDSTCDLWVYTVVLGNGRSRDIILEHEPSGNILVDWESAVIYQPMDWDRYAVQRPPGSTMQFRVNIAEDHFFSHEFANPNLWVSFRLTTPDSEETLFGYAPKGGPVATALLSMLRQTENKQLPVILRLGLPEGMLSRRGVIIEKILGTQWIYVNPPDSDS
jgi:hypothetical protein